MIKEYINKNIVLEIQDIVFDQVIITQLFHKNLFVFGCLSNALRALVSILQI